MKNRLELIPLCLFSLTAVFSYVVGNLEAGLGWTVASMVQLRVITLINVIDNRKDGE